MPSDILFFILIGGIVRIYYSLAHSKKKLNKIEFLISIIFSTFTSFAYIVRQNDYNLLSFTNVFLGTIIFFSIVYLAKYILPKVNEIQILIWVTLYWYIRFSLGFDIIVSRYVDVIFADIILIILSAVTFIISVLHVQLNDKIRLVLYVWFLTISTSVLYFALPNYSNIISSADILSSVLSQNFKTYVFAVLYGFQLFYVVCNVLYLFYLIPIPAKNQSMKDRINDLREFIKLLTDKFDSYQFKSSTVIVSISVVVILLYINFNYGLLSISNTILLTLTVASCIYRRA